MNPSLPDRSEGTSATPVSPLPPSPTDPQGEPLILVNGYDLQDWDDIWVDTDNGRLFLVLGDGTAVPLYRPLTLFDSLPGEDDNPDGGMARYETAVAAQRERSGDAGAPRATTAEAGR